MTEQSSTEDRKQSRAGAEKPGEQQSRADDRGKRAAQKPGRTLMNQFLPPSDSSPRSNKKPAEPSLRTVSSLLPVQLPPPQLVAAPLAHTPCTAGEARGEPGVSHPAAAGFHERGSSRPWTSTRSTGTAALATRSVLFACCLVRNADERSTATSHSARSITAPG